MHAYKLEVKHDGDFYHERPYNIVIHEDKDKAEELIIEALRELHETFDVDKKYLEHIKISIGKFLEAYDDPSVELYQDEYGYDIWVYRNNGVRRFDFVLHNGNQSIEIYEYQIELEVKDNCILINEDKVYGY